MVATQAYVGRRKDQYRGEFILALKILGEGAVTRKDFRSSWAGATGYTQFLPSEYYKHGVDLDGDGRVDIWHSVPDALASAAQQLVNKGWQAGVRWAYEVKAPANVDCTMGVPEVTKPIGEWLRAGFVPVRGQKLSAAEQAQPASLLQVEGIYGPAFLTTKNYFVIKEYNFSDLYVLFVGHLADRMTSPQPFATPWSASTQLRTADVEAMQRHLTRIGLYKDKLDGKAGMQTRAALGAYQKSAGLKVDCWPSEAVLRSMSAGALMILRSPDGPVRRWRERCEIRGRCQPNRIAGAFVTPVPGIASLARATGPRKEKARPRYRPGFDQDARLARQSIRSVADLDAAIAPVIAVPEALANHPARRVGRFFHVHRAAIGRAAGGDRATDDRAAEQAGRHACGNATLCACGRRCERTGNRCDRDQGSKCLLHVLGSPGVAPSSAGFRVDSHAVSNCRFAKKAHMGQSKVNVPKAWSKKTVFSGRK